MITIKEIPSIKLLKHFKLIAGYCGLDKYFSSVVIFEYESFKMESTCFYQGDFIVTTLLFAKDHPELLIQTLKTLIQQGVVGMAIKTVYYQTLPKEVIELADEKNLPIFLFDDTYLEDVIVSINDYIKSKQSFSEYEKDLHRLLSSNDIGTDLEEICLKINPYCRKFIASYYLKPKEDPSENSILEILNSLSTRKNRKYLEPKFRFLQYKEGLFVFLNSKEELSLETLIEEFRFLFQRLDIAMTQFFIGVSEMHLSILEFDLCLKESFYSYLYSKQKKRNLTHFSELDTYRLLYPLLQDKISIRYYKGLYDTLVTYDNLNNTSLVPTLFCYQEQNCDIKKTASILFQHPNTIRYRIEKIKELLRSSSDSFVDFMLPMLTLLWYMDSFYTEEGLIESFRS